MNSAKLRELLKKYDIIGISFITPNFLKAREMARLIRLHSPDSVIVLGGHGAAIEGVEKLTHERDSLDGIEVAVDALALAEGDMDVQR